MKVIDYCLNSDLTIKKYKKEEILYYFNQVCEEVSFVKKGTIRIVNYSIDGQEEVLSIINEHELFANALIFSIPNRYLGDVIASKDCEIINIKKKSLESLLQNDLEFLNDYINILSIKTIEMTQRNKVLLHRSIKDKIFSYLELHNKCLSISITSLSKELSIPRPSLSREINNLIRDKVLIRKDKKIYLNNY